MAQKKQASSVSIVEPVDETEAETADTFASPTTEDVEPDAPRNRRNLTREALALSLGEERAREMV